MIKGGSVESIDQAIIQQVRAQLGIEPGLPPRRVKRETVLQAAKALGLFGFRPLGKGRPGKRRPLMPVLADVFGFTTKSLQRIISQKRRG